MSWHPPVDRTGGGALRLRSLKASGLDLGFRRPKVVAALHGSISFPHPRVVLGNRFDVSAGLAMDLAVFQGRLAAQSVRDNVFENNPRALVEFGIAGFAIWLAVSRAAAQRGLANLLWKLAAFVAEEGGHAPTRSLACHAWNWLSS